METQENTFIFWYRHADCLVESGIEWFDLWTCACNGRCPACGIKDVEPVAWQDAQSCFDSLDNCQL